jgi:hypothetical protein
VKDIQLVVTAVEAPDGAEGLYRFTIPDHVLVKVTAANRHGDEISFHYRATTESPAPQVGDSLRVTVEHLVREPA